MQPFPFSAAAQCELSRPPKRPLGKRDAARHRMSKSKMSEDESMMFVDEASMVEQRVPDSLAVAACVPCETGSAAE